MRFRLSRGAALGPRFALAVCLAFTLAVACVPVVGVGGEGGDDKKVHVYISCWHEGCGYTGRIRSTFGADPWGAADMVWTTDVVTSPHELEVAFAWSGEGFFCSFQDTDDDGHFGSGDVYSAWYPPDDLTPVCIHIVDDTDWSWYLTSVMP